MSVHRSVFWIVLLGSAALPACKNGTEPPGLPTLAVRDTTLLVDERFIVPVTARDASGRLIKNPSVTFSSSAPSVVSISGPGVVTAISLGTSVLTATMDGIVTQATITVAPHFTHLAVGAEHACGITGRGEVYCWGTSFRGELGPASGMQESRSPPPWPADTPSRTSSRDGCIPVVSPPRVPRIAGGGIGPVRWALVMSRPSAACSSAVTRAVARRGWWSALMSGHSWPQTIARPVGSRPWASSTAGGSTLEATTGNTARRPTISPAAPALRFSFPRQRRTRLRASAMCITANRRWTGRWNAGAPTTGACSGTAR